jgi:hypothetical protein
MRMREQDLLETWISASWSREMHMQEHIHIPRKMRIGEPIRMPMESHTYVECSILKTKYYLRSFHKYMIMIIFFSKL